MAKIDVTKIENYANMTLEEKLSALEAYEIDEPDFKGYVKKDTFDKTASELAEYKRQLKAKMTEDEKKEAERAEEQAVLKQKYDELMKETNVAKTKSKFMSLGYDENLADLTAKAFVEGDSETVFANQQKFLELKEKQLRAQILDETPKPPAGNGGQAVNKEYFDKMTTEKQLEFIKENPNWKEIINTKKEI